MSISTIITILFIIYIFSKVFGKKPAKPGNQQYRRTGTPDSGNDVYTSSTEGYGKKPGFEDKKTEDYDILAELENVFAPKPPEPETVPGSLDTAYTPDDNVVRKTRIEEAQRLIPQTEIQEVQPAVDQSLIEERAKQMAALLKASRKKSDYASVLRKKLRDKNSFKEAFILSEIIGVRKY
jgi:hypothetical protein